MGGTTNGSTIANHHEYNSERPDNLTKDEKITQLENRLKKLERRMKKAENSAERTAQLVNRVADLERRITEAEKIPRSNVLSAADSVTSVSQNLTGASRSGRGFYRFTGKESIRTRLAEMDLDEVIERVHVYEEPWFPWQLTKLFCFHPIVVLETRMGYWSIEKKLDEEITLQMGEKLWSVRDIYGEGKRVTCLRGDDFELSDIGQGTVEKLLKWLDKQNEDGCAAKSSKDFAREIFNQVAVTERYKP